MVIKNINPNKLHDELLQKGINPIMVRNDLLQGEYIAQNTWITFEEGTDMELTQGVINNHDPSPLPQPLPEVEKLRIEQAKANAELIELMMSILGGGF